MTITNYVWNAPKGGNWSDASNWKPNGVPGALSPTNTATIGSVTDTAPLTVILDTSPTIAALTLNGAKGAVTTLAIDSSQSLIVSGVLKLSPNSEILGNGVLTAKTFGGVGAIVADGGTLALNGAVNYGVVLQVDAGAELLINGTATSATAIALGAGETIGVGVSGAKLTFQTAEEVSAGGAIVLGGGTLSTSFLTLDSGANLSGSGTVTGQGLLGSGTVTALGDLTINAPVDNTAFAPLAASTNFDIGSAGDGTASDLIFANKGLLGTDVNNPTVTFENNLGTLDASVVTFNNLNLGVITDFQDGDFIDIKSSGKVGDTWNYDTATQTLTITSAAGKFVGSLNLAGANYDGPTAFTVTNPDGDAGVDVIQTSAVICFMAGTMIRTPDGEVAVETLAPGDLVMTTDDVAKPVAWLGKQTVSMVFADPLRSLPIRVKAGALDENVPARDLLISPDHALLVDGVLIHAGALVNGTSILRETAVPQVFVYYHVELDDHSLILAENAPAETFVDNIDRLNFDNWAEHEALYPEGKPIVELPYPRAKARRQVPVDIRVALAERAQLLGFVEADVAVA
jgi:hypothetical protein